MGKLISSIISIAYLVAAFIMSYGKPQQYQAIIGLLIFLILPLCCIWFPSSLREIRFMGHLRTSEESESIVKLAGWILLLLPIAIFMIFYLI
jgi:hypothetical protein